MNYKISYDFDAELNCGIIRVNDNNVLMDFVDLFSIINFDKNFIHYEPTVKKYPYYFRKNIRKKCQIQSETQKEELVMKQF